MQNLAPETGYARLTTWQARTVLGVVVLASLLLVGVTLSSLAQGYADKDRPGEGDREYESLLPRKSAIGQVFAPVAGFADNGNALFVFYQTADTLPCYHMVLSQKYVYSAHKIISPLCNHTRARHVCSSVETAQPFH